MKKKLILGLGIPALVALCAIAVVGGLYYIDNKAPGFEKEYVLYVYPDYDLSRVKDSLCSGAGALRPGSLDRAFGRIGTAEQLKPGRYVVSPESPSIYVARMLAYGWQTPQQMTISGTIRTRERLAKKISSQMMVDSAQVCGALYDADFLAAYGFTPENVFALILPDTYQIDWTASVTDIFDRLKKEYDKFWTKERIRKAELQGLTPIEASIMASIVSGETLKDFEYPKIAGVYLNRLHKGHKLQADPTVCFCYDYTLDRVLKKHLQIDSPYNTYKYAGLPPAPINVPPKACIEAVLNPDEHGYFYFCASAAFDGTHKFAVTYGEHMKNAREFQRELTRRRREKSTSET